MLTLVVIVVVVMTIGSSRWLFRMRGQYARTLARGAFQPLSSTTSPTSILVIFMGRGTWEKTWTLCGWRLSRWGDWMTVSMFRLLNTMVGSITQSSPLGRPHWTERFFFLIWTNHCFMSHFQNFMDKRIGSRACSSSSTLPRPHGLRHYKREVLVESVNLNFLKNASSENTLQATDGLF